MAGFTQGGLMTGNTAGGVGSTLPLIRCRVSNSWAMDWLRVSISERSIGKSEYPLCGLLCKCVFFDECDAHAFGVPYYLSTAFGYASYNLTPDIQASTQLNYANFSARKILVCRGLVRLLFRLTMRFCGRAAAQFGILSNGYNAVTGSGGTAAAPTQSIKVGTINTNNAPAGDYS